MRLGILSDTHDEFKRTRRAVELLQAEGAECLVHCGDLISVDLVPLMAAMPWYFTFGNHDADLVPGLRATVAAHNGVCLEWGGAVELAGKWIGITHGHMSTDVRRLLTSQPDYLLTGHTHCPCDRQHGATRRINPGALSEADEFTVALLDLTSDEVRFLVVSP